MTHKIAILGASGYTGAELVRLIATHPTMEIVALSADRKAGMDMSDVFPQLISVCAIPKNTSNGMAVRTMRSTVRPRLYTG